MIEETIKPDQDSQFRLLPCECGGEPVYEKHISSANPEGAWCVCCPVCKRGTKKYYQVRHDAQQEWNKAMGVAK